MGGEEQDHRTGETCDRIAKSWNQADQGIQPEAEISAGQANAAVQDLREETRGCKIILSSHMNVTRCFADTMTDIGGPSIDRNFERLL